MAINTEAVQQYIRDNPNVDAAALNDVLTQMDTRPAPAREDLPATAPVPGMGGPSIPAPPTASSAPAPTQNMRAMDARSRDEWDVDLRCLDIAGIAADEVRAAREAYEAYDEYVSDNYAVLAADWADRAAEKEARELAEYVNAGKPIPEGRVSAVETAMRERPLALATARKLRDDVRRADIAAIDAFNREAPDALPRLRSAVTDALADAEAALAAFVRATVQANAAHREWAAVRVKVDRPTPSVAQMWTYPLIDTRAGVSRLDDSIRDAKRRIGPAENGTQ